MKAAIAIVMLTLAVAGGAVTASAADGSDCHSISDSVYGLWAAADLPAFPQDTRHTWAPQVGSPRMIPRPAG